MAGGFIMPPLRHGPATGSAMERQTGDPVTFRNVLRCHAFMTAKARFAFVHALATRPALARQTGIHPFHAAAAASSGEPYHERNGFRTNGMTPCPRPVDTMR